MPFGRLNRLFWWRDAKNVSPERCAAQVMVMGGWGDVMEARRRFGEEIFAKVLRNPPRGLFDTRSWTFWHKKTGMVPVPPLPKQPAAWPPLCGSGLQPSGARLRPCFNFGSTQI